MSDPSLGSERNLADYREEHPFDAFDRFCGAPPEEMLNAEKAAPPHLYQVISRAKQGVPPPPPAAGMVD